MNRKDVINVLKMENDLITFDPTTGEDIDVRCLNELNKKCYIAHEEAIEFLKRSIPVEWILNKYREKWGKAEMGRRDFQFIEVIDELLADWKKENENI